jgi:hypothetical protein
MGEEIQKEAIYGHVAAGKAGLAAGVGPVRSVPLAIDR